MDLQDAIYFVNVLNIKLSHGHSGEKNPLGCKIVRLLEFIDSKFSKSYTFYFITTNL